jgi:hypothetical protein
MAAVKKSRSEGSSRNGCVNELSKWYPFIWAVAVCGVAWPERYGLDPGVVYEVSDVAPKRCAPDRVALPRNIFHSLKNVLRESRGGSDLGWFDQERGR